MKEYLVRDERFGVPDAVYFGANAAGEFADYAVVVEAPTSETAQMIRRAKNGVITRKILDAQLHELGLFPNSRFYLPHRAFDYLPESYQRIALRGEPEMQAGPATFYCAWAAGCNPIIAIGFDFNFLPDRTHYYGEDEATRKQGEHAYRWDETNLITTHMWRAARASGVEIVVVSEISRFLEGLAPRMPIGEAIKRAASKDRLQPVG